MQSCVYSQEGARDRFQRGEGEDTAKRDLEMYPQAKER